MKALFLTTKYHGARRLLSTLFLTILGLYGYSQCDTVKPTYVPENTFRMLETDWGFSPDCPTVYWLQFQHLDTVHSTDYTTIHVDVYSSFSEEPKRHIFVSIQSLDSALDVGSVDFDEVKWNSSSYLKLSAILPSGDSIFFVQVCSIDELDDYSFSRGDVTVLRIGKPRSQFWVHYQIQKNEDHYDVTYGIGKKKDRIAHLVGEEPQDGIENYVPIFLVEGKGCIYFYGTAAKLVFD